MLLRAWLPFLSMLLQIGVAIFGSDWIDSSPRYADQGGPWGYAFGVFIGVFLYASWPLVITFLLGISASLAPDRRRALGTIAALVAAVWGVVVGGYGLSELVTPGAEADQAFGAVLATAGVCSVVPLLFAFGRTPGPTSDPV